MVIGKVGWMILWAIRLLWKYQKLNSHIKHKVIHSLNALVFIIINIATNNTMSNDVGRSSADLFYFYAVPSVALFVYPWRFFNVHSQFGTNDGQLYPTSALSLHFVEILLKNYKTSLKAQIRWRLWRWRYSDGGSLAELEYNNTRTRRLLYIILLLFIIYKAFITNMMNNVHDNRPPTTLFIHINLIYRII